MPIANNDQELMLLLLRDLVAVGKNTGDNILAQIQQSIDSNVYEAYPNPVAYNRLGMHGGFIGSWINESTGWNPNEASFQIFSDPNLMEYNPQEFQHGNDVVDRRSEMSEDIIDGRGYDWPFYMHRDFWEPVISDLDAGAFEETIEAFMTKQGLDWQKI